MYHGVSSGEPHAVHKEKSGVQREVWWANANREREGNRKPKDSLRLNAPGSLASVERGMSPLRCNSQ